MPGGMRLGIGAGAVSVLAALVAVSPAVQGAAPHQDREDRHVRIVMGGGSHLGVRLEDVGREDVARLKLSEERGALVKSVEGGSPADKAGMKAGDVIVRYHGESVMGASQLARLVRETPPGRTVPIEVVRDGAAQKVTATLGGDRRGAFGGSGGSGMSGTGMSSSPRSPASP